MLCFGKNYKKLFSVYFSRSLFQNLKYLCIIQTEFENIGFRLNPKKLVLNQIHESVGETFSDILEKMRCFSSLRINYLRSGHNK